MAEAVELFEQETQAWELRRDAWAIGYGTERDLYATEVEPPPRYRDVLTATAKEWRARESEILLGQRNPVNGS